MKKRIDFSMFEKPAVKTAGGAAIGGDLVALMNDSFELKEVINVVQQGHNAIWVSDKKWSMHHMLMALLDITGPAAVHIATYAMGATPANILLQLKENGLIQQLYCVIDNRVDTRSAISLQTIMSITDDYALDDVHAKVTVIQNSNWNVTVIGSANYTENVRVEAGIIMTTPEAAQQQLLWIKKILQNGVKQRCA